MTDIGRAWDLLVIGGGTAGIVGAKTAAGLGARVVLVERDRTGAERERVFSETTDVTFYELTEAQIAAYVRSGEPMDKAGAYGIQGYGATIVERVDGDYFAVMGLSLVRATALLAAVGVGYAFAGGARVR